MTDHDADALNDEGVALAENDRAEEAEALWALAIERNADHVEARYNRACRSWRTGVQIDLDVVEELRDLGRRLQRSWRTARALAFVQVQRWGFEAARALLEEATALGGDDELRGLRVAIEHAEGQTLGQADAFEAHDPGGRARVE